MGVLRIKLMLLLMVFAIGSSAGAATVAIYTNITKGVNALEEPADIGDSIRIVIGIDAVSAGGISNFSIDVECASGGSITTLPPCGSPIILHSPCGVTLRIPNCPLGMPVPVGDYVQADFTVPECVHTTCGDGYIDVTYGGTIAGDAPANARLPVNVPMLDLDFGDAPAPYPTLVANNGAYHIIEPNLYLGRRFDFEDDGWPSAGADGDDANGIDDEDGVEFLTRILLGDAADVNVAASAAGLLDAWLDFNIDGDWLDPGEQIFTSYPLNPGGNIITFNVPTEAAKGESFARFRFSTAGGLDPNGPAEDGEVEDYKVFIGPCPCWGDIAGAEAPGGMSGEPDGKVNAADMTALLMFLFLYGKENRWLVPLYDGIIIPDGYECMNLNDDMVLDPLDMNELLIHLFLNGGTPENGWTADYCYKK